MKIARIHTSDPMLLHRSNLLQCETERVYHKHHFYDIDSVSLIKLQGANEQREEN